MFKSTPAVKTIFYINIVAFVLTSFFPNLLEIFGGYNFSDPHFEAYQLITYQFLHGGILHILFNMLAFISLAPVVEDAYGEKQFWIIYLLCGVASAVLQNIFIQNSLLIGASGSICGIVAIFALMYPNQKLQIFFIPAGIKAKYVIGVLFLIEVFDALISLRSTQSDHTGHFGHIGGALCGCLVYLVTRKKLRGI